MRVLVIGAGGVGAAAASVAARRDFFERMVIADVDPNRARAAVDRTGDPRFAAAAIDASDSAAIAALARTESADAILNAVDPRFNPAIFAAAFDAGCTYLDMAMTLSEPHPDRPYEEAGVKLGDAQFAAAGALGARRPARARRDRRRARALGRLRPLRPRRTLRRDRRDRRPRRREPRRRRLRLRAHLLDLDDDRGVPQPAGDLGARAGAGSRPSRSPSPRCSTSRRGSARSSASTSSTRRCC